MFDYLTNQSESERLSIFYELLWSMVGSSSLDDLSHDRRMITWRWQHNGIETIWFDRHIIQFPITNYHQNSKKNQTVKMNVALAWYRPCKLVFFHCMGLIGPGPYRVALYQQHCSICRSRITIGKWQMDAIVSKHSFCWLGKWTACGLLGRKQQ